MSLFPLLRRLPWNWKTALCSACYRAPAYFLVSLRLGPAQAFRASAAEFLLFGIMAGFTGALIERLRHLRPLWLAALLLLGALPLCLHTAEWLTHSALGTPARRHGLLLSIAMSILSDAFTWRLMHSGAMLTGPHSRPLLADLARIPAILFTGLLDSPPRRS